MESARQEDYFVLAKLSIGNSDIPNVPCKIFLPQDVKDPIKISLRPQRQHFDFLSNIPQISLYAECIDRDRTLIASITVKALHIKSAEARYWGPEISEWFIESEPRDMRITSFLRPSDDISGTHVVFWISPNRMLSPTIIERSSYLGSVEVERLKQIEFPLNSGITLKFDTHFRSRKEDSRHHVRWSMLVAEGESDISGSDADGFQHRYLESLDDFLLLASLGSRIRTVCMGWATRDRESYTQYFRKDIYIHERESELNFHNGLVSLADYKEFLSQAYRAFCTLDNKQAVRGAIYALVPNMDRSMEGSFLALFAGLEELVLDFRKRENLECVLADSGDWRLLRNHIQKSIKSWEEKPLSKEQRGWLYAKLHELNRIPLEVAFTKFCKQYRIDLSDLWPVFQQGESLGLSDIRNRIVHGAGLPAAALDALLVAMQSLQWTLERMMLGLLGWSVERSDVAPSFLQQNATAIADLPEARSRLLEIIPS